MQIFLAGTALCNFLQVSKALLLLEANMQKLCKYLQVVNFQIKYAKKMCKYLKVEQHLCKYAKNPWKSQLWLRNIQMHPHVQMLTRKERWKKAKSWRRKYLLPTSSQLYHGWYLGIIVQYHSMITKIWEWSWMKIREVCRKSKWKFKMVFAIRRPPPPHSASRGGHFRQILILLEKYFIHLDD